MASNLAAAVAAIPAALDKLGRKLDSRYKRLESEVAALRKAVEVATGNWPDAPEGDEVAAPPPAEPRELAEDEAVPDAEEAETLADLVGSEADAEGEGK